jgi:hypothetical protein
MTLQALRNVEGEQDFVTIMRQWLRLHHWGNAASVEFAKLASRVSGHDLTRFFDVWLAAPHRPAPFLATDFRRGSKSAARRVLRRTRRSGEPTQRSPHAPGLDKKDLLA